MWRRGWSGANPRVVSPRGRGCSGRNHGSTVLSGGRGSHRGGDGGRSNCRRGSGRRSGYGLGGGSGRSSWRRGSGGRSNYGLDDGGMRSSARVADRGMRGTAHPWPESASSTGLRHTNTREGEERGRWGGGGGGGGKWNEKERKDIGFIKEGGAIERSWPINGPIKWLEQKIEKLMVGTGN